MAQRSFKFDFFIAHAGADREQAEALYDLLAPRCRVFFDSRCLLLGDDWDSALAQAQRDSAVTVVLISSHTEKAYYQREEIAAAIAMARLDSERHRVVPVYLDPAAETGTEVPYGLRLKHGLFVSTSGHLSGVAESLLDLLRRLQEIEGKQPSLATVESPPRNHTAAAVPPPETAKATGWWAIVRTVIRNPRFLGPVLLAAACYGFFQVSRHPVDRAALADRLTLLLDGKKPANFENSNERLPADLLASELYEERSPDAVAARWYCNNAKGLFSSETPPKWPDQIELRGPGYAFLKAGLEKSAFYDFQAEVFVYLVRGNAFDLCVRVWPRPSSDPPKPGEPWRARFYRFQFEVQHPDTQGSLIELRGYKCSSVDPLSCERWYATGEPPSGNRVTDNCGEPKGLMVTAKAFRKTVTIAATVTRDGHCPHTGATITGRYEDRNWRAFARYGGIGFRAADENQVVGIGPLFVYDKNHKMGSEQ